MAGLIMIKSDLKLYLLLDYILTIINNLAIDLNSLKDPIYIKVYQKVPLQAKVLHLTLHG